MLTGGLSKASRYFKTPQGSLLFPKAALGFQSALGTPPPLRTAQFQEEVHWRPSIRTKGAVTTLRSNNSPRPDSSFLVALLWA